MEPADHPREPSSPAAFAALLRELATVDDAALRRQLGEDALCNVLRQLGYAEGVVVFEGMRR